MHIVEYGTLTWRTCKTLLEMSVILNSELIQCITYFYLHSDSCWQVSKCIVMATKSVNIFRAFCNDLLVSDIHTYTHTHTLTPSESEREGSPWGMASIS